MARMLETLWLGAKVTRFKREVVSKDDVIVKVATSIAQPEYLRDHAWARRDRRPVVDLMKREELGRAEGTERLRPVTPGHDHLDLAPGHTLSEATDLEEGRLKDVLPLTACIDSSGNAPASSTSSSIYFIFVLCRPSSIWRLPVIESFKDPFIIISPCRSPSPACCCNSWWSGGMLNIYSRGRLVTDWAHHQHHPDRRASPSVSCTR